MQQASPPVAGEARRGPSRVVLGVVLTFLALLVVAYVVWAA